MRLEWVDIVNCVLACILATDYALGKPISKRQWHHYGAILATCNGFHVAQQWASDARINVGGAGPSFGRLVRTIHGIPRLPLDALEWMGGSPTGARLIVSLMLAVLLVTLLAARNARKGRRRVLRSREAFALIALLWIPCMLVLVILPYAAPGLDVLARHGGSAPSAPARVLFLAATYFAVCYGDVRRRHGCQLSLSLFTPHFLVSAGITLALLPVLAVCVGAVFMVLVVVLEGVGGSAAWLNWPIYYCVLYGPWSLAFFLTKRRCLRAHGTQLLPK
eukprot:jgi/Mesvir1/906/Mv17467-RA.1